MSENDRYREILQDLAQRRVGQVTWDAPLGACSSWRIGGPADLLIEPGSIAEVQRLSAALRELGLPSVVIGDGSNLLFDDQGVRGAVVKIGRRLARFHVSGATVTAEAGVFVPRLVYRLGKAGLTGLEHAIGIPGTLGGLILMNGGSLRKEVGASVECVWGVTFDGSLVERTSEECHFSYRHSGLQAEGLVVVKARLRCEQGDPKTIRSEMLRIARSRRSKFPLDYPNSGSVFLSTPSLYEAIGPPGKIIEQAGLPGARIGDAMVSRKHANFIVNLGRASSQDVLALIQLIRDRVFEKTGFSLRCEVRHVSPSGSIRPADQVMDCEGSPLSTPLA